MRRAILFLIFALFLAMVIQPNLNKQIKETSKIDVPEQAESKTTLITNDTVSNKRSKSKAIICIDASRGGSDAGYTSEGHTSEKELNLASAQKIGDTLESVGYKVVYTRSDDSSLTTEDRITALTAQKADYLISIQMNSSSDSLSKGYSIFTQPNEKMIQLAKELASTMSSINLSQFEGIDSDHYENFPILYDSQIPSILLELGYLSNSDDYSKLIDETFQQKIADAITQSFLDKIN